MFDKSCINKDIRDVAMMGSSMNTRSAALEAVKNSNIDGDWAEFGVHTGGTARFFIDNLPQSTQLYLFDSFKGLPEQWDENHPKGHFACDIPSFDNDHVSLVIGWFDKSVPKWARHRTRPLSFIHIDSDIYSSAKTVLWNCNSLIVPGTIILFDEFYGYKGWDMHEYRAYKEWINRFGRRCSYLGRSRTHRLFMKVEK